LTLFFFSDFSYLSDSDDPAFLSMPLEGLVSYDFFELLLLGGRSSYFSKPVLDSLNVSVLALFSGPDSFFVVPISVSTNSSVLTFLFFFYFFFFSGFNAYEVVRISLACVVVGSVGVEVATYSLTSSVSPFFFFFLILFLLPIFPKSSSLSF